MKVKYENGGHIVSSLNQCSFADGRRDEAVHIPSCRSRFRGASNVPWEKEQKAKREKRVYKSVRNRGYPLFPRVIPIARLFFSTWAIAVEKSPGENILRTHRIYSARQKTHPITNYMFTVIWFLNGYLRFRTLFSKHTKYKSKYKYYKEMGKKTYLGMTIHKLGLAKFQNLCFKLIDWRPIFSHWMLRIDIFKNCLNHIFSFCPPFPCTHYTMSRPIEFCMITYDQLF